MIPDSRWFPTNFPARADWFSNFSKQFATVADGLGFSSEDTKSVENDNQVMLFLAEVFVQAKAFDDAVRAYRTEITEGDTGETTPQFPANPAFNPPVSVPTGIYERLDNLVKRIRVAPGYTDETGALLGIIPKSPADKPSDDVKPMVQTFAAQFGHHFSVVVENRGKATMWDVLIRREKQEKWQNVKTASGKSVNVEVELSQPDTPERIQVIVQLKKNNENYGQPSDPVYVTLNP